MYKTILKTIPEYPDYSITKDGRVWSKPRVDKRGNRRKGKWLKPKRNRDGYLKVSLRNENGKRLLSIHRLVLETYLGQCPPGKQSRHLNGNTMDNRLENLCWGTHQENMNDRRKHGNYDMIFKKWRRTPTLLVEIYRNLDKVR